MNERLDAKAIIVDTAFDADRLRKVVAIKRATAVILLKLQTQEPPRRSTTSAIWSNAALAGSSTSAPPPSATRRRQVLSGLRHQHRHRPLRQVSVNTA